MEYSHIIHGFGPVYDSRSRILILGSLPSVKSREQSFYYGHPQNRFWRLIADICGEAFPETVEQKKQLLLCHGIAVYDVIYECDIIGSSDTSIRNVIPTDLRNIMAEADIKAIFVNGAAAEKLFIKYHEPSLGVSAVRLPSTSPANAAWSYDKLRCKWDVLSQYIDKRDR